MKSRIFALFVVALFSSSTPRPLCAQSNAFNVLYSFTPLSGPRNTYINSDGVAPNGGLSLSGNTLYGTTFMGGDTGQGTVFRVNLDGSDFTNLYTFTTPNGPPDTAGTNGDGAGPVGSILSGCTLYGAAWGGGSGGSGTVFRINTDGSDFTTLYSFTALSLAGTNADGADPHAGLFLSGDTLFGTTQWGGSAGYGTVFRVNTDGSDFTNLYNFTVGNGGAFFGTGLILSGNTLYGTKEGDASNGMVFRLNTDGSGFTNLHSFTGGSDGVFPNGPVIISGNTLYGTADIGGSGGSGTVFAVNTDGSGFTILYSFTGGSDGGSPIGRLTLSGNTLYGAAQVGGGNAGSGTVFKINTNGSAFTNLYTFTEIPGYPHSFTNSDGAGPDGLLLSGNTLYGTADGGGSGGSGTVFALTLPAPSLGIAPAGNQIVISWPVWSANYALQTATDLSSGTWSNLTNGIGTDGTNYLFTNTVTGQTAFFRLQQQ